MRRARSQAWRRAAAVVGINVGVALGLLLLLEAGVRLARPDIGPAATDAALVADRRFVDATGRSTGLRPGARGTSNGALFSIDARGFLRYRGNAALPDSAGAWLLLGDSVAMGIGVPPDATFAGLLALSADSVRVLNPSLIGYSHADYLRVLRTLLADDALRIRRVTLVWCLNDPYPETGSRDPGQGLRTVAGGTVAALNRHSRLYRLLKSVALDRPLAYYEHDRQFYTPHADALASARPAPDAPFYTDALPSALESLAAMRALCAARAIPFEVVIVPYEPQLRPPSPGSVEGERLPQRLLLGHLETLGIPALDLAPAFVAAAPDDPSTLFLWADGIHLSPRGHAVAAETLAVVR
ncbi:MAG: hypothetical protein R3181_06385 [Rubricoccaceae bacterium]|nr:hypothetical protein [Rubricoccaceae bacterium]